MDTNNERSCCLCRHLISNQIDVVCHVFCSIHGVDFTFEDDPKPEEVAKNCKDYADENLQKEGNS
jgi:hypothetical protein